MNVLRWLTVSGALMVGACGFEGDLYAVGTLERDRIELSADSSEPIVALPVREGDRIAAGDVVLAQDPALAETRLAQARARRDQARGRLEEAVTGPRPQDIERARARLAAAESAVETASAELARERALIERNFASANRVDVLQGRYREAVARRREARAALDELREGTRAEVLAQLRDALAAADAALTEAALAVERTRIDSPVPGTVEALPLELGERPGVGQTVAVVRALAPTFARVHVPEALRAVLEIGAVAEVHIDGHEGSYSGRLRWIATEAAFTPYFALTERDRGRLAYLAEVELTGEAAAALPAGVPVEVFFPGAARSERTSADPR